MAIFIINSINPPEISMQMVLYDAAGFYVMIKQYHVWTFCVATVLKWYSLSDKIDIEDGRMDTAILQHIYWITDILYFIKELPAVI